MVGRRARKGKLKECRYKGYTRVPNKKTVGSVHFRMSEEEKGREGRREQGVREMVGRCHEGVRVVEGCERMKGTG